MRSIGKFSDELHFPLGFQQTGCFTAEEVDMLEKFGLTMQGLQEGALMPETAEEHYFLAEVDGEFSATSALARCWRKYCKKVTRCELSPTSKADDKRKDPAVNDYADDSFADGDSSVIDDDEFLIVGDDDISTDTDTELNI